MAPPRKRIPGTFIVSSANGKIVSTITNVHVGGGQARFERVYPDLPEEASELRVMSDDELLIAFLEGRAFRLGEV